MDLASVSLLLLSYHVLVLTLFGNYGLAYQPITKKLTPAEIKELEMNYNQKPGVQQAFLDYNNKYNLHWEYDNESITFDVSVAAKGWIGLGFTPNHGMADADIVFIWIDGNGQAHISDRHAKGNEYPTKDDQQDYTLLSASKDDQYFRAKFRRLRNTCDNEGDYRLTKDNVRVIWAFSDVVPVDEDNFEKHAATNRGVKGLYLFDSPNGTSFQLPPDTVTLDLLSNGTTLPTDNHLMYWCQVFEMPKLPVHHLIRFDGVIEKGHEAYVHHVGFYQCSKNMSAFLGKGERCFTGDGFNLSNLYECRSKLLWFWSPGMKPTDMPEGVGFPLFESAQDAYMLVEIHYENIDLTPGIVDHSGLRLYVTPTLRPVEAGMMFLATIEQAPNQILPPGEEDFHFYAHFDNCLAQLPESGTKIAYTMLHEHLYGRKIRMHHYRKGVQLPDIAVDNNFDFFSQAFRALDPPRVVLPGDEVVLECIYDTRRTNRTIYGGYSTYDEMCGAPSIYYPRVGKGFMCMSYPDPEAYVPIFGAELVGNDTVLLPSNENVTLYEFVKHHLDWEKPGVRDQYREMVSDGQYVQQFFYQPFKQNSSEEDPPVEMHVFSHNGYPTVTKPWKPEVESNECAMKPQKSGKGGGTTQKLENEQTGPITQETEKEANKSNEHITLTEKSAGAIILSHPLAVLLMIIEFCIYFI